MHTIITRALFFGLAIEMSAMLYGEPPSAEQWAIDNSSFETLKTMGATVSVSADYRGEVVASVMLDSDWKGGDDGLRALSSASLPCTFDIEGSAVSASALAPLARVPKLQKIILRGPKVSNDWLAEIGNVSGLKELFLFRTSITDDGLRHLKGLSDLEWICITDCTFTGKGLSHLAHHGKLKGLSLNKTKFDDRGMALLHHFPSLGTLNLDDTCITNAGIKSIGKIRSLRKLSALRCNVTDIGLSYLEESSLEDLTVESNGITDIGLESIAKIKGLTELKCGSVIITDKGVMYLVSLDKLKVLAIKGFSLEDNAFLALSKIQSLRNFYLDTSMLSPEALANFQSQNPNCTIKPYLSGK